MAQRIYRKEAYEFPSLKKTFAEKEIPVLDELDERTLMYVFGLFSFMI